MSLTERAQLTADLQKCHRLLKDFRDQLVSSLPQPTKDEILLRFMHTWTLNQISQDIRLERAYLQKKRELQELEALAAGERFKVRAHAINLRERVLGARLYRLQRVKYILEQTEHSEVSTAHLTHFLFHDVRDPSNVPDSTSDMMKKGASLTKGYRRSDTVTIEWQTTLQKDSTGQALIPPETQSELLSWICEAEAANMRGSPKSSHNQFTIPTLLSRDIENSNVVMLPMVVPDDDQAPQDGTPRFCFWIVNSAVSEMKRNKRKRIILNLSDLDGKELIFSGRFRPSLFYVYLQFVMVMAVNRLYRWDVAKERCQRLMAIHTFSHLKRYIRQSFLEELGRRCGFLEWTVGEGPDTSCRPVDNAPDSTSSLDEIAVNLMLFQEPVLKLNSKYDTTKYQNPLDALEDLRSPSCHQRLIEHVIKDIHKLPEWPDKLEEYTKEKKSQTSATSIARDNTTSEMAGGSRNRQSELNETTDQEGEDEGNSTISVKLESDDETGQDSSYNTDQELEEDPVPPVASRKRKRRTSINHRLV